jgi:ribosomal protein S27E
MNEPDSSFIEIKCHTCSRQHNVELVDGLAPWPSYWRVTGARFQRVVCPTCAKKLHSAQDSAKMT